nr:hypothetical protein [Methylomarinum sp. Ch1-1]MDP4522842.1 hypothetical protein [Methylomarinum sp. Ch1-1]
MDCLAANPSDCDANVALPSDVLYCVKHIKNRCASRSSAHPTRTGRLDQAQRSANLERLREASRQKMPPKAKLAVVRIQADCLAANPSYRDHCIKGTKVV